MPKNPKEPGVIGAYCSKEMENAFTYYAQARNLSKSKLAGLLLFPALMRLLSGDAELPQGQWIETLKEQALAVLQQFRSTSEKYHTPTTALELSASEDARSENVPIQNSSTSNTEVRRKVKKLRTAQKEIMGRGSGKNRSSKDESKTGHTRSTG